MSNDSFKRREAAERAMRDRITPPRLIRDEDERWTILNALADYRKNLLADAQQYNPGPQWNDPAGAKLRQGALETAAKVQALYERVEQHPLPDEE